MKKAGGKSRRTTRGAQRPRQVSTSVERHPAPANYKRRRWAAQ